MTTLTPEGQRLHQTLRQAGVVRPTSPVPINALNAAAASLRLPLEGDASLREAANGYFASLMQTVEWVRVAQSDPKPDDAITLDDVDGDELEAAAYFIDRMSAALARPQPEAKGPVAAGVVEALLMARQSVVNSVESYRPWVEKIAGRVNPWQATLDAVDAALASTTPPAEAKTLDAATGERPGEASGCEPGSDGWTQAVFPDAATGGSAGEDDTRVREIVERAWKDGAYWARCEANNPDVWLMLGATAEHYALKALAPQPPKAETPAGVEALFGSDEYVSDLPSAVAAEVMGLAWTHAPGDDLDEHCDRYGSVQEAVDRVLQRLEFAALSTAPAARPGDEVEADKDRLDWLEQAARKSRGGISFDHILSVEGERSGFRFMRKFFIGDARDNLRSAIDAARGEVEQIQRRELAAAPAADGGRV